MGPWDVGPPGPDGTPGMGSFHGVPCHSRGWHPRVPCTIGWPLVSDGTLGCAPSYLRRNNLECNVFYVIPGADIAVSHVPSLGHLSHTGHWAVGPATQDETPWNVPIPGCSVSFQGPTFPWPVYHRSAIGLTQDTRMWAPLFETGRLEWDHSKVFRVIPGAGIPVSCVLWVSHQSHMGHWGVGPATRDRPPWNRIIPRRSVSFQGPTSPCAMYYQPVINLTQNSGMWGHSLKTEHPGMG